MTRYRTQSRAHSAAWGVVFLAALGGLLYLTLVAFGGR